MKTKLRLSILGIAALFLATRIQGQDVQVVTTTKTNLETETIYITDIYTRDGMTNLVCQDEFRNGGQARNQKIYHDGVLLGKVVEVNSFAGINGFVGISTEPNPTYSLTFQFATDKTLQPVGLQGATVNSNYFLVDAFDCTNGVLFPMYSSKIEKVHTIDNKLKGIFDSKNLQSKSSEEIERQMLELVETNKSK